MKKLLDYLSSRTINNKTFLLNCINTVLIGFSIGIFFLAWLHKDSFFINYNANKLLQSTRELFFSKMIIFVFIFSFIIIGSKLLEIILAYYDKRISIPPIFDNIDKYKIFLIAGILPLFFNKDVWRANANLHFTLLLLTAMYVFYYFNKYMASFTFNTGKIGRLLTENNRIVAFSILGLGIIGYTWYMGHYTIISHNKLQTNAYDLGIFANAFWNTTNGDFLHCGLFYPKEHLFGHSHLTITPALFIVPILYFFTSVKTILVLQCFYLALAALPIYLIAQHLIKERYTAIIIALCYLLNPALHGANFYDFHETSFIPLIAGFLLYFWIKGSYWQLLFLPLFLLIKEDMAIIAIIFSLFFIVKKETRLLSVITIFTSLVWYYLTFNVVLPAYGYDSFNWRYLSLMPYEQTSFELVKTLLINPLYAIKTILNEAKITYFFLMLLPLAILPILRARYLPLIAYGIVVNLLTHRFTAYSISFQYVWYLLTGLYVIFIFVYADIKEKRYLSKLQIQPKAILLTAVFLTVIISFQYGAILNKKYLIGGYRPVNLNYTEYDEARLNTLHSMIEEHIPDDASVAASERLVPHAVFRKLIFTVRFLDAEPDYYLLFNENFVTNSKHEFYKIYHEKVKDKYTQIANKQGFVIYKKN